MGSAIDSTFYPSCLYKTVLCTVRERERETDRERFSCNTSLQGYALIAMQPLMQPYSCCFTVGGTLWRSLRPALVFLVLMGSHIADTTIQGNKELHEAHLLVWKWNSTSRESVCMCSRDRRLRVCVRVAKWSDFTVTIFYMIQFFNIRIFENAMLLYLQTQRRAKCGWDLSCHAQA